MPALPNTALMSAKDLSKHWIRPEIQAIQAYPIPDSRGLIKLDAMENPYGWPGELLVDWH